MIVAPFSAWISTREELPRWARRLAAATAVGTVVVDGGLLKAYRRNGKPRRR